MATGPFVEVTCTRDLEAISGVTGNQTYRLTVTNRDTTNTVKVSIGAIMTKWETSRAYTSSGVGITSGNTASGTGAIADTAIILTAGGQSYVTYVIVSTLTLPTGRLYGRSTFIPTVRVIERPSGTTVTEAAIACRPRVTYLGTLSLSEFGTRHNEKNSTPDDVQIGVRLIGKGPGDFTNQRTLDILDDGARSSWDTVKALYATGTRRTIRRITGVLATITDDDGFVSSTGTATFGLGTSHTDPDNLGREIILKNSDAALVLTVTGNVDGSAGGTTVAALKAKKLLCDGVTWVTTGVVA